MNTFLAYLSVTALMVTSLFLIFIILLQRGRGGGLAGAFGGAGGQSALGTKAGDVFTKITVGLAIFWVFLACLSIYALRAGSEGRLSLPDEPDAALTSPAGDEQEEAEGLLGGEEEAAPAADNAAAASPATADEVDATEGPALPTPSGDQPVESSEQP